MGDILFLCHRIPWPADRGDKIRSHWMLRRLASIAPVHVGSFAEDAIQEVIAVDAEPKKPATDPLADIGVVPSADPTPSQGSGASSGGAAKASATPKANARDAADRRSSPDAAGRSLRDSPGPLVGE